jgi:hypothetical protein
LISIAIRAHPRRERWVRELRRALPGAQVVWDRANDEWDTGRRALLAFDPAADFHAVIEDDAIPARDLAAALPRLVEAAGTRPISLYLGVGANWEEAGDVASEGLLRARRRGAPWVEMQGPCWGVGVVLPTRDIPALVEWADSRIGVTYDSRIAKFYRRRKVACWYTVPSLVDHRPELENRSLLGHDGDRRAGWFCEGSALDIDFKAAPHVVDTSPAARSRFRHPTSGKVVSVARRHKRYLELLRDPDWVEQP